ncbi:MAG TPA: outer membrane lipoprotein carrier protein LolA [Hyphomicrobiales bacterium]|nr:outer membrane lipoprotein carrier protein LolA [Hyphomicrobiales bacterium]
MASVAFASLALAQGGQTEVSKTAPSNAPPVLSAPAAQAAPATKPPPPAPQAAKPQQPANQTASAGWQANVAQPPQGGPTDDLALVTKVNDYFNKLTNLQGTFIQTDPDNRQKQGRFYFERPGKIRFDYSAPPGLRIVSDGHYVAIENYREKTSEKYPLDVTPFRLLLAQSVDLANDAKILGIDRGPDTVVLTLEDKKGEVSGRIRLFLDKDNMRLKEWIITDAQGLDTRIEVANLEENKKVDDDFFELSVMLGIDRGQ